MTLPCDWSPPMGSVCDWSPLMGSVSDWSSPPKKRQWCIWALWLVTPNGQCFWLVTPNCFGESIRRLTFLACTDVRLSYLACTDGRRLFYLARTDRRCLFYLVWIVENKNEHWLMYMLTTVPIVTQRATQTGKWASNTQESLLLDVAAAAVVGPPILLLLPL